MMYRLVRTDPDPSLVRVEDPAAQAVWARNNPREDGLLRRLVFGWAVPVDDLWVGLPLHDLPTGPFTTLDGAIASIVPDELEEAQ